MSNPGFNHITDKDTQKAWCFSFWFLIVMKSLVLYFLIFITQSELFFHENDIVLEVSIKYPKKKGTCHAPLIQGLNGTALCTCMQYYQ